MPIQNNNKTNLNTVYKQILAIVVVETFSIK